MSVDASLIPFATAVEAGRYADPVRRRAEVGEFLRAVTAEDPPWLDEVDVEDIEAPGLDGQPTVRLRLIRPKVAGDRTPALLWVHGGGFISGDLEVDWRISGRYAVELGIPVVHVDYRLAPEDRFPAAILDTHAALRWMRASAEERGFDPARLVVAGSSAGGALALGAQLRARDEGDARAWFQALLHPVVDDRMITRSVQRCTDTPAFTTEMVGDMWQHYLGAEAGTDAVSAYAAPARAESLRGLPPAYVMVAGLDPLHDEGVQLAQALEADGIEVTLDDWDGAFHGFMNFDADLARRATDQFLRAVRAALSAAPSPG